MAVLTHSQSPGSGLQRVDDPAVIGRVLKHLGLPTEVPEASPARAPPLHLLLDAPMTQIAYDQINPADQIDPA